METIYIHSFSKYGKRDVNLPIFDRLIQEGKIYAITKQGKTSWFFKPLVTITKKQKL